MSELYNSICSLKLIWNIRECPDIGFILLDHPYQRAIYVKNIDDENQRAKIEGNRWLDIFIAIDQCIDDVYKLDRLYDNGLVLKFSVK
jgi:hypothetical protein